MKTKSLFAIGLAAFAFAACTNDDVVPGSDNNIIGGGEDNAEPTWVSLRLATESAGGTRAASGTADDVDKGLADNATVKDAVVLIFNATTKVLEYKVEFNGETKKDFLATPGQKIIYALANVSDVKGIKDEIDKMVAKTSSVDDYLNLTYTGTNAGLKELTASTGYVATSSAESPTHTFKPSVEAGKVSGTDNAITVKVKYMAAQIGLKLAASTTSTVKSGSTTLGKLSNLKFVIRNIAKESYIAQKYPTKGVYYTTAKTGAAEWAKLFFSPALPAAENLGTVAKYFLATENVNETPKAGNSTYAAIEGVFSPAVGTVATAVKWNELTGKIQITYGNLASDTTFYVSNVAGLADVPVNTIFDSSSVMEHACAMAQNGKEATHIKNAAGVDVTFTDGEHYLTHTGGKCYYRMNIGEGKDDSTTYLVERAKKYTATINNITGLGYTTEDHLDGTNSDGVQPELPLTQQTYIDATIAVEQWVDVSQSGDLN